MNKASWDQVKGNALSGFKNKTGKQKLRLVEKIRPESRIELIQMLIPLGLQVVQAELEKEVEQLAGKRYSRSESPKKRWGSNPGSVYLGDQKVSIDVPRVRNTDSNEEVPLETYKDFQSEKIIDDQILKRVINGISTRKYEKAVIEVPETFGIKKSSISKKFIKASEKKLKDFFERDLSNDDIVAIFIDGKALGDTEVIIALGIDIEGNKKILGLVESCTESYRVCVDFFNDLIDRGLDLNNQMLFIIDGAKGLSKGIKKVVGKEAVIQRCQWHKRENVLSYLSKKNKIKYRKKLQNAYEQTDYNTAKYELQNLGAELRVINNSAYNSLMEGFEETLTLHRLGMFSKLGKSFKTTNCIEGLNRQLGIYTDRICYWKNSDQRRRWTSTALLEIEPKLKKVHNHRYLKELRYRMIELKHYMICKEVKKAA